MILFRVDNAMVISTFCGDLFSGVIYNGVILMVMGTLIQRFVYGVIVLFIVVVVSRTTQLCIL